MSRGYSAEFVRLLHEGISRSVVKLIAFKSKDGKVAHLGTGVIVCCDYGSGCIGIITTISCDPNKYKICARFGDQTNLKTEVLLRGSVLSGLVIRGYDGVATVAPVSTDDLFEDKLEKSEPVWSAGCFGENLEEIMPRGNICICNIRKRIRADHQLQTFVHSCPIGDGLIGAPVINRFGRILGITIARSMNTAVVNHGMRLEEMKKELTKLANGENSEEEPMSSLLIKFGQSLLRRLPKKSDVGSSSKKTKRIDAGSSSQKARKT